MLTLGTECALVSKELTFGIIGKAMPHFPTIGNAFCHRRNGRVAHASNTECERLTVSFATLAPAQMCPAIGADVGHGPAI